MAEDQLELVNDRLLETFGRKVLSGMFSLEPPVRLQVKLNQTFACEVEADTHVSLQTVVFNLINNESKLLKMSCRGLA